MSEEITLLDKLLTGIYSFSVAIVIWAFKSNKEKLDRLSDRVIVLETQAVTDEKVRDIVKEELSDVKHDVSTIKDIVTELRVKQAQSGNH
jgi:hypothetical protein